MFTDKRVAIMVGGREMLVEENVAKMVELRRRKLIQRSQRISRELKLAGMLPAFRTNQFAGWVPTSRKTIAVQSCVASGLLPPVVQKEFQPVEVEADDWLFNGSSSL